MTTKKVENKDTIVAQATPPGRGGVGILRISGIKTCDVAKAVLGELPKPRYAKYISFKDTDGTTIDQGIALWFPGPHSFTGEDLLELQGHGGPVILDILLKRILTFPYVRIANPGEFSERAFLNGKLDLIQAESIADLIDASTEQAARFAISSFQGTFSTRVNFLVSELRNLRIYIEADIEFHDEAVEYYSDKKLKMKLNKIISYLDSIREAAYLGTLLREGIRVVIAGYTNAGKSSLLNALTGRESAIVTDIEGTTRDILHEYINIDGVPVHLIDTAGLRDSTDIIERIGIERAWKEIEHADHLLFILDSVTTQSVDLVEICPDLLNRIPDNIPITVIRNKSDITGEKIEISNVNNYFLIRLSARTGEGIDILCNHLKQCMYTSNTEGKFIARRRHLQALDNAASYLKNGKDCIIKNFCPRELLAEELRLAQKSLSEITGEYTSKDLIKDIFSKFCIGK